MKSSSCSPMVQIAAVAPAVATVNYVPRRESMHSHSARTVVAIVTRIAAAVTRALDGESRSTSDARTDSVRAADASCPDRGPVCHHTVRRSDLGVRPTDPPVRNADLTPCRTRPHCAVALRSAAAHARPRRSSRTCPQACQQLRAEDRLFTTELWPKGVIYKDGRRSPPGL